MVIIRAIVPGTVTLWVLDADAILLVAWVREGALAPAPRRLVIVGGSVVGGLVCTISAVLSIILWRAGGIAM